MTLDNYHAAVDARGRWRLMPKCGIDELWKYIRDKQVEFVILPWPLGGSEYSDDYIRQVMADSFHLHLLWKGDYDYVYRVNPPAAGPSPPIFGAEGSSPRRTAYRSFF